MGRGRAGDLLFLVKASAPGKIILFGEHAVVYGRPALAVPVTQVCTDVEVLDLPRPGIWVNAPDISLHAELNTLHPDHPIAAVINGFFPHPLPLSSRSTSEGGREEGRGEGVEINISSTIPVASGLGSGAAVSVALVRALSLYFNEPLTDEQISGLVFEIEKLHHGTPSGIDNSVITFAKPVYFVKGKPIEILRVGRSFSVVIGDTGLPAPTKESVGDVRKLWEKDKDKFENLFDEIAGIALRARRAIESGEPKSLGKLMNDNHALLQTLTVSSPELDRLVEAARTAGALGAKLSGGGRGGNMITLVEKEMADKVANTLLSCGAKRIIVTEVK